MLLKRLTGISKFVAVVIATLCFILTSCKKEEINNGGDDQPVSRVVFVYAVNNSSLASDFKSDRGEMEMALLNTPNQYKLLLYCIDNDKTASTYKQPCLLEAVKSNDQITWRAIKTYDSSVLSTDASRIETVISDGLEVYPEAKYDLFFWGHGTAWYPSNQDKIKAIENPNESPEVTSYGGEYTDSGKTAWTKIDELADAIPDYRFGLIWFDCCYMSNIETLYQLRNKCDIFVGYATEIWQYGLQYELVLPYIMRETQDVTGAAKALFDYYNEGGDPVTVAVSDMSALENVADATKKILATGSERPSTSELVCYSRSTTYAFYDFAEFIRLTARRNLSSDTSEAYNLISEFNDALNELVVYHDESTTDFNHRLWDVNAISGISTHYFTDSESVSDDYYRTLDWYNRVYK